LIIQKESQIVETKAFIRNRGSRQISENNTKEAFGNKPKQPSEDKKGRKPETISLTSKKGNGWNN